MELASLPLIVVLCFSKQIVPTLAQDVWQCFYFAAKMDTPDPFAALDELDGADELAAASDEASGAAASRSLGLLDTYAVLDQTERPVAPPGADPHSVVVDVAFARKHMEQTEGAAQS